MELFTYNSDLVGEGQDLLLSQFKDKTKFLGLLAALLTPAQDLEDTLYALLTQTYVDNAVGAQLDIVGAYVGLARQGYNDNTYRLLIKVQIAINTSHGTPNDIISIMLLITGATNCLYLQYQPASMDLQVNVLLDTYLASLPMTADNFLNLIRKTIPAGVELYNISCYDGPNTAFGFFEDPDALGYDDGAYANQI